MTFIAPSRNMELCQLAQTQSKSFQAITCADSTDRNGKKRGGNRWVIGRAKTSELFKNIGCEISVLFQWSIPGFWIWQCKYTKGRQHMFEELCSNKTHQASSKCCLVKWSIAIVVHNIDISTILKWRENLQIWQEECNTIRRNVEAFEPTVASELHLKAFYKKSSIPW